MFDRGTVERLVSDIEEVQREHGRAQARFRTAREQIADLAIAQADIPADLFEDVQAAEWEIKFYADRLEELKQDFVRFVRNITL